MVETSPQMQHTSTEVHVPESRVAHEFVPVRDSLFAILSRRMSFVRYRSSPRYARTRALPGAESAPALPLLVDTLTIYFADVLPSSVVARLGPGGIARLARATESVVKRIGRIILFLVKPLRWGIRIWRTFRAQRAARLHRRHVESMFMSSSPGGRNLGVLLDGRIVVEGFAADHTRAQLWLRSVKPVHEACQVFIHLYPEQRELLPPERRVHGYLCKDHYPAIEVKNWRSDRYFRDEIAFGSIAPGFYRIEAGIIDVATFRRFPVDGSVKTSIDLGWVRIGPGGPA